MKIIENEFLAALYSAEANPEPGENLDLFGQLKVGLTQNNLVISGVRCIFQ